MSILNKGRIRMSINTKVGQKAGQRHEDSQLDGVGPQLHTVYTTSLHLVVSAC